MPTESSLRSFLNSVSPQIFLDGLLRNQLSKLEDFSNHFSSHQVMRHAESNEALCSLISDCRERTQDYYNWFTRLTKDGITSTYTPELLCPGNWSSKDRHSLNEISEACNSFYLQATKLLGDAEVAPTENKQVAIDLFKKLVSSFRKELEYFIAKIIKRAKEILGRNNIVLKRMLVSLLVVSVVNLAAVSLQMNGFLVLDLDFGPFKFIWINLAAIVALNGAATLGDLRRFSAP